MRREKRGVLFTLAGGVCWGFSGTCGQYLFSYESLSPIWLTAVRMLSAGVVLVLLAFWLERKKMRAILCDKNDLYALAVFSVLGLISCQYTYLVAISHSNAGTATVLQYLGPAFVLAYACLRARRRPNRRETCAVLLAIAGTALIATQGDLSRLAIPLPALVWGLLAAISLAIYTIAPERIMRKWGSLVVTGYGMLLGGIVFFLMSGLPPLLIALSPNGVAAVLAIIWIGTIFSFSLYLQGVADIGPVKASMLACVEPVAATAFSAAWLGTAFSAADLAGFAAILTTVLLLTKK